MSEEKNLLGEGKIISVNDQQALVSDVFERILGCKEGDTILIEYVDNHIVIKKAKPQVVE